VLYLGEAKTSQKRKGPSLMIMHIMMIISIIQPGEIAIINYRIFAYLGNLSGAILYYDKALAIQHKLPEIVMAWSHISNIV
jgi:hypothetical protein